MTMQLEHINRRFRQLGELTVRLRWAVIVSFVITSGIALWGMTLITFDTSNDNWFFEGDALKIATDEFNEIFGNSAYPAILVEAEDVFAPNILRMIRELGEEMLDRVPFADEVYSLTEAELITGTEEGLLIEPIVPDEIPATPAKVEEIRQRAFSKEFWYNRLFTPDSRMTWIILRLHSYPDDWRQESQEDPEVSVGRTVREILAQEKYHQFHLKASGMPVLTYDKRSYVGKEMGRMMPLAFLVALAILAVALRSVRGMLVPLLSAISSIVWVAGANGLLGVKIDPVVIMVPMFLVLAVSIGYSIHVFNFFRRYFQRTGKRREAIYYAIEHTGWPLFFTALTTMGALIAFMVVPIFQVHWIGWTSAGAVAANYVIIMFLTPALLSFGKNRSPKKQAAAAKGKHSETWLTQFSQWILTHPLPVVVVFAVSVVVFGYGMPKIEVDQDMERTWGLDVEWVKNLDDIRNTSLGSLYSFDLTLTFDEENCAKQPDAQAGVIGSAVQFSVMSNYVSR